MAVAAATAATAATAASFKMPGHLAVDDKRNGGHGGAQALKQSGRATTERACEPACACVRAWVQCACSPAPSPARRPSTARPHRARHADGALI